MTMKNDDPKRMGCSKSSPKREVYSNTILPQETKISNKQPDLPSKGIRKRSTNKAQSQQKEGNDKFREEIKKIETKKQSIDSMQSLTISLTFFAEIEKVILKFI